MKELIQYLQTLPIAPLIWVEVAVSAVASVLAIVCHNNQEHNQV